ncbi:hypothetical protein D9M69_639370 [compost metagenome]
MRSHRRAAAHRQFGCLAAPQAHDIAQELDLVWREVAMGARHLPEDMARIDKQHLILAKGALLPLFEEPQRHRKGDGKEHVGRGGDEHIHRPALNQLASHLPL